MSSDRANNIPGRPSRPNLVSNRPGNRTPLTPRLAASAASSTPPSATQRTPTVKSDGPTITPRAKQPLDGTPVKETFGNGNVTPRSSARQSKVGSASTTPSQAGDSPNVARPRSAIASANGTIVGLGVNGGSRAGNSPNVARPRSVIASANGIIAGLGVNGASQGAIRKGPLSDTGLAKSSVPFVRSPVQSDSGIAPVEDSIDSRFFHASDLSKTEPAPKRPEPKKHASFVYADGQSEAQSNAPRQATSPVLSTTSQKRTSGQWSRLGAEPQSTSHPSKSPPVLPPGLSTLSSASPFFAAAVGATAHKARSPSPPKDNIHLSYRKGASQIIGSRPSPIPSSMQAHDSSAAQISPILASHRKSTSLSSIDSGSSHQSRRRSGTTFDAPASPPAAQGTKSATVPRAATSRRISVVMPIDTPPHLVDAGLSDGPMSPTKSIAELAADARRERKVLDLEISNSSLLAINASLEREVRRQKIELKRFRRLSRAGRFSFAPLDPTRPGGLGTLNEEGDLDGDGDFAAAFGPPSGFTDIYDDFSDDDDDEEEEEEDSSFASGDTTSPDARQQQVKPERLAKDERRLRFDMEKHKELLVQSQMMNQSLKRCMYATEDMMAAGRKAMQYRVRVSDVKLGGRILTGHDEDEESGEGEIEDIEVEDDFDTSLTSAEAESHAADDPARTFLDVWGLVGGKRGIGAPVDGRMSLEESEAGDRDSGIEVDKPALPSLEAVTAQRIAETDPGRPPGQRTGAAQ